jgi:hypothetical protein
MEIQRQPLGNYSLWFLAQVAKDTPYESIASETLKSQFALRNSRQSSLDFLAAGHWEIGNVLLAEKIAEEGKNRDCTTLEAEIKLNCLAWYDALIHKDVEEHIAIMEPIVQSNPGRSDYADTLAVLYRANKNPEKASVLAKQAMIFAGSDPYMIWQALSDTAK